MRRDQSEAVRANSHTQGLPEICEPGTRAGPRHHHGLDHILHQLQTAVAIQRKDRFRVELHGLDGKLAVPDAHDDAVIGFRGDLETGGKACFLREQ